MGRKLKTGVSDLTEPLIPPKRVSVDVQFRPQTPRQREAVELWKRSRILFLFGPAGTGKTLTALGLALTTILNSKRDDGPKPKIVLTRPAVTVDEDLGFLPGDLVEKLHPFVLPFHDVFRVLSTAKWSDLEKEVEIETVPVGMMRGRTFTNTVVLADEIQNLTYAQLKCLVTRIGRNSRIVLSGDQFQSDRYTSAIQCPALQVAHSLQDLDTVSVIKFTDDDVLRDPLIADILARLD